MHNINIIQINLSYLALSASIWWIVESIIKLHPENVMHGMDHGPWQSPGVAS